MINFKTNINFMKNGSYIFIASILMMIASCLLIFFKGLNLGIDFTKGTRFDIVITQSEGPKTYINVEYMESIISNLNLGGQYTIKELNADSTPNNKEQMFSIVSQSQFDKTKIIDQINKEDNLEYNDDKSLYQTIGPKMGSELASSAKWSLGIAIILILIYITFRFNSLFALSSILALIHDILITTGIFSLFNFEISLPIIAAFLMILGYSLNDTIVVFDRIRENLNPKDDNISDMVNHSINQTLSRTVLTSLTTLIVLIILYFVGSYLIKLFTLALIIGVIIGTYSSIFVASFSFKILYNRYGHLLNQFDLEEDED
tara:strand:+ start:47 stop:997 length:951 start_codon:yes stop_codon:yes gene_type:complete